MSKVLIVATSRKTRGGITSVIKAHESGKQWTQFHCHWVQTHRDGPLWRKLLYFATGMIDFLIRLPFYDIVHIHTADYNTEKRKRIFVWFVKLFGKKLIVHLHSSGLEYSIGGQYRELYKYSFMHADKIIALSNMWRDEIIRAFNLPEDKVEILYNPCPQVIPSNPDERKKYILFAGTLTNRKGYADLIQAFALIAKIHPDWRLKLAGNGEIENGKKLVSELGVAGQVDFLGWIDAEEKDKAFRYASIYCLPSYSEGFPMGVLDAWAYHLPVATTPVGGILDVAQDNKNLLLFTPGDTSKLAALLSNIISSPSLQTKLSDASKFMSDVHFNINTICSNLSNIYKNVTE